MSTDNKNLLSKRVLTMAESATLEMTRRSRELKDKGVDVISLSIGEPDFNTPEIAKKAAITAINNNDSHYPPVPGVMALRKAISEKLKHDNNLDYAPAQIIVSNGAKQSISNVFLAILNDDDEVVIPAPYWVSYPEMVKMAGGKPVFVYSDVQHDFKITGEQLEKVITPKTKALIFSSPCNPSGSVYSKSELESIAKVLKNHPNIIVIADEIYEYIQFGGKHESIGQFDYLKDQLVVVNGVSKGYAMTGWRIGYIAAPLYIANACSKIQGQMTSGCSTISQAAALEAMKLNPDNSQEIKTMTATFKSRRDMLYALLKEIPGMIPNYPQGAFYIFPDISYYFGKTDGETVIKGSMDLCLYLLDKAQVALVSGDAFGCDNCIRFSYSTSDDALREAVRRIKAALERLH